MVAPAILEQHYNFIPRYTNQPNVMLFPKNVPSLNKIKSYQQCYPNFWKGLCHIKMQTVGSKFPSILQNHDCSNMFKHVETCSELKIAQGDQCCKNLTFKGNLPRIVLIKKELGWELYNVMLACSLLKFSLEQDQKDISLKSFIFAIC